MIRFMIQKLLHKKWMVISLLIGNILLIAIASSNPMYKNAALQRTLTEDFNMYLEENNTYPGMLHITATLSKGKEQETLYNKMNDLVNDLPKKLGVQIGRAHV